MLLKRFKNFSRTTFKCINNKRYISKVKAKMNLTSFYTLLTNMEYNALILGYVF